jgi:uncharacterized protein (TIGR02246 family)
VSLREALDAWTRALEAEDAAALGALAAPDAVFLAPGKAPLESRDAWLAARSPRLPGVELSCTVEKLVEYGDRGHAWCEITLTVPAAEGAPEIRVEGHLMALYRREADGRWLREREASMLAPAR